MDKRTAFFTDEMTFWHCAGNYAFIMPVGGYVQPSSGPGFVESPEIKRRFKNLLDVTKLSQSLAVSSAELASESDLLRIHPKHYLDKYKAISDSGGGELGIHAPVGPGSYEIAKLSAGLAIAAIESVLTGQSKNAYALTRPPGHHCLPDLAMGTCTLANIPIAIETAKARHGVEKIAVIDWDVHHGNGTQTIYEERADVLTISIHQENCFPLGYSGEADRGIGAGAGLNINIPLPAGSGHDAYIQSLSEIVIPALEHFSPDLIVVACGYDANAVDPMARMLLHSDTFRVMTAMISKAADQLCNGKLVFIHEGGYSEAYVPFCGLAVMEQLSGVHTGVVDPLLDWVTQQQPGAEAAAFLTDRVRQLANLINK